MFNVRLTGGQLSCCSVLTGVLRTVAWRAALALQAFLEMSISGLTHVSAVPAASTDDARDFTRHRHAAASILPSRCRERAPPEPSNEEPPQQASRFVAPRPTIPLYVCDPHMPSYPTLRMRPAHAGRIQRPRPSQARLPPCPRSTATVAPASKSSARWRGVLNTLNTCTVY